MKNSWIYLITLLIFGSLTSLDAQTSEKLEILVIRNPDFDGGMLQSQFEERYRVYGTLQFDFDVHTARTVEITPELLANSNADVLFLPNLYEGNNLLNDSEIQAIVGYAGQGHAIVGSHGTLEHYSHASLGPLFGVNGDMISGTGNNMPIVGYSQQFSIDPSSHPVLWALPPNYSTLSVGTLAPPFSDNTWEDSPDIFLKNASIIARSTDNVAAIFATDNSLFRTLYMTHYPSQLANDDDLKLLYNAFVWVSGHEEVLKPPTPTSSETNTDTSTKPVVQIPLPLSGLFVAFIVLGIIKRAKFSSKSQ